MKRTVLMMLLMALLLIPSALVPTSGAQAPAGAIAYVRGATIYRGGNTIRLIEPDGSNDRHLWTVPHDAFHPITDVDWRPDSRELAFASSHEGACSIYDSDIYTIRPDGGGLRRVTNAPDCAGLAAYPKGSVTITIQNLTTEGPFGVYLQGAPGMLESVVVPAGGTTTVTFHDVADFGATLQQVVAISGAYRWFAPILMVDVKAGEHVLGGTLQIKGLGVEMFGAYVPVWHRDGTRLGYGLGGCGGMWQIGANPGPGERGTPLLNTDGAFACVLDWGPTAALANELLYWSYTDGGIYRVSAGSNTKGTKLVATDLSELVFDVQWLPDGSGFLFNHDTGVRGQGNIYVYHFATGATTQLTNFTGQYLSALTISPDGQWIAFDRATSKEGTPEVWLMRRDGSDQRLLVRDAALPAWSQSDLPAPLSNKIFLPMVQR